MLIDVLTLAIFPASQHGLEVSSHCVPGRNKVHVSNEEGEHHEGTYRIGNNRHGTGETQGER